jgi:hypothetical protein
MQATRYTKAGFKTKKAAKEAESQRREELTNPKADQSAGKTATDITCLDLNNLRLDHVKAYNSESHYHTYKYQARRWSKKWGDLPCGEITREMV